VKHSALRPALRVAQELTPLAAVWLSLRAPNLVAAAAALQDLELRQEANRRSWGACRFASSGKRHADPFCSEEAVDEAARARLEQDGDELDSALDELERRSPFDAARRLMEESDTLVRQSLDAMSSGCDS